MTEPSLMFASVLELPEISLNPFLFFIKMEESMSQKILTEYVGVPADVAVCII